MTGSLIVLNLWVILIIIRNKFIPINEIGVLLVSATLIMFKSKLNEFEVGNLLNFLIVMQIIIISVRISINGKN